MSCEETFRASEAESEVKCGTSGTVIEVDSGSDFNNRLCHD